MTPPNEYYVIIGLTSAEAKRSKRSYAVMAKYVAWKTVGEEDFVMEEGTLSTEMSEDRKGIQNLCYALSTRILVKISAEKTEKGFLMHKLLDKRIEDDSKANIIIEELNKELDRQLLEEERMLAKQQMEKEANMYKEVVMYNKVNVYASVEDKKDAPVLHRIVENLDKRVKDAIAFITENLKKVKTNYLYLRKIEVKEGGEYFFEFHYDDPTHAHKDDFYHELTVTVWGNIDTSFQKAQLNDY